MQAIWDFLIECQNTSVPPKLEALKGIQDPLLVGVGDLKLFLMAVFTIKGNKRMDCDLKENFNTSE